MNKHQYTSSKAQWDAMIAHKKSLPASNFGSERAKREYIKRLERIRDGRE